jgi:hypothetical protein
MNRSPVSILMNFEGCRTKNQSEYWPWFSWKVSLLFSYFIQLPISALIINIIVARSNDMVAKIKLIEPIIIKDKKIVREAIAQVRWRLFFQLAAK